MLEISEEQPQVEMRKAEEEGEYFRKKSTPNWKM